MLVCEDFTYSGENPANTSTRSLGYVSTSSPSCLLSTPLESSRDHNGLLLKAPTVTDAYRQPTSKAHDPLDGAENDIAFALVTQHTLVFVSIGTILRDRAMLVVVDRPAPII
ncbi:hypothetical protein P8C59_001419 [Phyllachora maydis]|uniref:Uncharacterized protein n=1 Tax=Phyllachora maydis TaxID=1825666 RepID=A0AAD9HYC9_9PEZI|nr:hypothetical protein P8C59_001419 [Phyllachora maydis]